MVGAILDVVIRVVDVIEGKVKFLCVFLVFVVQALLRLFFIDDPVEIPLPCDEVLINI